MRTRGRHRGSLGGLAACGAMLLLGLSGPASAQEGASATGGGLRIDHVQLDVDGASRLTFTVPAGGGSLTLDELRLFEDGERVSEVVLVPTEESAAGQPVTLAVLIDTSGSTSGAALDAAKAGAQTLIREVTGQGTAVTLISFADEAVILVEPTRDAEVLVAAVDSLASGGDTALNDAVLLAARALLPLPGDGRILLFTDGQDDGSATPLSTVAQAVTLAEVPVLSVVLETSDTDVTALSALAAATGGSLRSVVDATELADAFRAAASELPSTHELQWSSQRPGRELSLRLEVGAAGSGLVDEALVRNPRQGPLAQPRVFTLPTPGPLATPEAFRAALGALGLVLAAILGRLLWPRVDRDVAKTLRAAAVSGAQGQPQGELQGRMGRDAASVSPWMVLRRAAAAGIDALPRRSPDDDALALRIERAGWSLRPAEFQAAKIGAGVVAGVIVAGLTQNLILGLPAGLIGYMFPSLLLGRAHDRRKDAFIEQMPDVLQLLAGSLKAGYGLVQAMDMVVVEAAQPISGEFRRVLNEHLLGLEFEDALEDMAERIDSEDLRWVVVAMGIQRRVGGNLAELLETIAATLRERAALRRHVHSLSAEGRLSAQILTTLPFLIGGYVAIVNPEYIGQLFTDPRGRMMLGGALSGMAVGALWMRRMVDIDV